ncbi:MAG: MraY family glycosyltransferase [Phycisphaerales bacterium]|jgi:UDP-GlcNAc:undecaprenyl-phosphate GlcNAc-1-phosphate transferase|nr:MraY family glycosyltransferase [Phycisphaerales bacterium]
MPLLCLALLPLALILGLAMQRALIAIGTRTGALDSVGVQGHHKPEIRPIPNIGGVGVFWALAAPVLALLAIVLPFARSTDHEWQEEPGLIPVDLWDHLPGLAERAPLALTLLACLFVLHVIGLVDDRRPLGPWPKLAVMLGVSAALAILTHTRLLTVLDAHAGGPWLSYAVTILWLALVTNAMNFIDNMDGLASGVASIASASLLAIALLSQQWFIAAMLALTLGSLLAFLAFNFPLWRGARARIFMGDSGSLVVGLLLAFLSVRITYYSSDPAHPVPAGLGWHALLTPLVVLAIPLYDFFVVSSIRVAQGKSPFVGDQQHLSHRLVARGLSKRDAVLVIWGFAGVSALAGVAMVRASAFVAILLGAIVLLTLATLALLEYAGSPTRRAKNGTGDRVP